MRIEKWAEPPPMDTGAPEPALKRRGTTVWVAYRCANSDFPGWESGASPDHPGFDDYCAVLKFEGVGRCWLGPLAEEHQREHGYWDAGMQSYSFMRLFDTELREHAPDFGQWIATFRDDTLKVGATTASVVTPRVNVESPQEALRLCTPGHRGAGVDVRFDFGMLIRRAALKEKGIAPDALRKALEWEPPWDENEELLSIGPCFGQEALDEYGRRFNALGLEWVDDYFEQYFEHPDWLAFSAHEVKPDQQPDATRNRITSAELAVLVVDALVDAEIINRENLEDAINVASVEIEVRKSMGDY